MESNLNEASVASLGRGLLIVPCFNEALSIPRLIQEVREADVGLDIILINDGSSDQTVRVAKSLNILIIDLPCNLGVGHAVQTGFQYGVIHGYDYLVRIDGDGQHPPIEIHKMLQAAAGVSADLVVGSRFGGEQTLISTRTRYLGAQALARFLSMICQSKISDPTSGFWLVKRPLFSYFAREFPTDYPEPEALAILRRQGYAYAEVPVQFRVRELGESSIKSWGTIYYAMKVGLALVVDRLRPVNRGYAKGWDHD
ncbi:glycosyltransferase family 2 protein [Kiritimatiellota bacterium B12222]|nr:glycosyltransferase family 2 protein [Kiritimatiellota bacterium B12222]